MGQLSACETQQPHVEHGKVCGEAVSSTGTVSVEKKSKQPSFGFLS